jgi:nucleotide-binding universal stress UspA family protein
MYSRILVPVDGSEPSNLGLTEAIKLAKALKSQLRLLHIIDSVSMLSVTTGMSGYSVVMEQLRHAGQTLLTELETQVSREGVNVHATLIESGTTATGECVVREAHDWQADLIICGTHGRSGLERLLMGSNAEYILRHTTVPVLLVRPQPGQNG